MESSYENFYNNERVVELAFINNKLHELGKNQTGLKVLNVGGIPSKPNESLNYDEIAKQYDMVYKICDFRGGQYQGDFNQIQFQEKFDIIIFLSSLEHFSQCLEGDGIYREKEDILGFSKALNILNPKGVVLLTVPFGKQRWQPYHQNYDSNGILELTKGGNIEEQFIYTLKDNHWIITNPCQTTEILYDDKCHCVGCFKIRKV